MSSPGAKSLGGWVRYTLHFLRLYIFGVAILSLVLLVIDLFWPAVALREHLQAALQPVLSKP